MRVPPGNSGPRPPRRRTPPGARFAFALLTVLVGGCGGKDVRILDRLPEPVFNEPGPPPGGWPYPTTQPADPVSLADLEAAWRSHALPARQWIWIVVHHSATPGGNATRFDAFHREARGWDELGYDFVIGNGQGSGDGQVEVGSRWVKQKWGAHCATPTHQFNEHGVGVCLVGDFSVRAASRPTPAQWASLLRLCLFLCREYGIGPDHIIGHRDGQAAEGLATTQCPGTLDLASLRTAVTASLAEVAGTH